MAADYLASGGEDVRLWTGDTYSDIVRQYNSLSDKITCLAWSRSNSHLASVSQTNQQVSVATLEEFTSTSYDAGEEVSSLCWRDNTNRYLVLGLASGKVKLYDRKHQILRKTFTTHPGEPVSCLTVNRNYSQLASYSKQAGILLHNLHTDDYSTDSSLSATAHATSSVKLQTIKRLGYSRFQALLASVSEDCSLVLWDPIAHVSSHHFPRSHKAPATSLSFSPSNDKLVVSSGLDKRIVLYDVLSKTVIRAMSVDSPLTSISMHSNGCLVASGTTSGQIFLHDLRMGTDLLHSIRAHRTSVTSLIFQNRINKNAKKEADSTDINTPRINHTTQPSMTPRDSVMSSSNKENEGPSLFTPESQGDSQHVITPAEAAHDDRRAAASHSELIGADPMRGNPAAVDGLSGTRAAGPLRSGITRAPNPRLSSSDLPSPRQLVHMNGDEVGATSREAVTTRGGATRSLDPPHDTTPQYSTTSTPQEPPGRRPAVQFQLAGNGHSTSADGSRIGEASLDAGSLARQISDEIKRELKSEIISEVKNMIDEMKEDIKWYLNDIKLETVIQSELVKRHAEELAGSHSINKDLIVEIETLKSEIERLRHHY